MFYVYLLNSGNSFYLGYSDDLKRRLKEHNSGQNISTKKHTDWNVIFYEAYAIKSDALRREKYLKTTQGKQALRRMLRNYYAENKKYFDY